MIFENPGAFWLFAVLPLPLLGLGLWGWAAKREIVGTFHLDVRRQKRSQMLKYSLAGCLMALLVVALAVPKLATFSVAGAKRTGEIALLVDDSASMAARPDPDSPSRLERAKPILYDLLDRMKELGDVRISLHGFTSIARSHVPFVGEDDYPYLRESIRQVLDIQSTPGSGTSLGRPILNVADKFSEDAEAKLLILLGDGETFLGLTRGVHEIERGWIEEAIEKARQEGIKVITVGIGEREGAKVPVYNTKGTFTGDYAKLQGAEYITYLEEEGLQEIASQTGGKYFYEKELDEFIEYIEENLVLVTTGEIGEEVITYRSIAHWFVLGSLPLWVVFARRYLLS